MGLPHSATSRGKLLHLWVDALFLRGPVFAFGPAVAQGCPIFWGLLVKVSSSINEQPDYLHTTINAPEECQVTAGVDDSLGPLRPSTRLSRTPACPCNGMRGLTHRFVLAHALAYRWTMSAYGAKLAAGLTADSSLVVVGR